MENLIVAGAVSVLALVFLQLLEAGWSGACAFAIDSLASAGALRARSDNMAAYLRNHAAEIGSGPSTGTMSERFGPRMCGVSVTSVSDCARHDRILYVFRNVDSPHGLWA